MTIRAIALALMLFLPQGQVRDNPGTPATSAAMLSGTVTDDTGAPVAHARVTLANSGGTVRLIAGADDAGRFAFAGLPAGQFALRASQTGYLDGYARTQPDGKGALIALGDAQQLTVALRLSRAAHISGRLLDEDGAPIPGLTARAYRYTNNGSSRQPSLVVASTAVSDRDGKYRLSGLASGDYVISSNRATPGDGLRRIDSAGNERALIFLESYYPGTARPADATVVSVATGDDRTGVDVVLKPTPASSITGTARMADGSLPTAISVELRDAAAPGEPTRYRSASGAGGRFIVGAVPAGRYDVIARGMTATGDRGVGASSFGMGSVTTDGTRTEDVIITLVPGGRVTGRLSFDAHTQERPANAQMLALSLRAVPGSSPFAQSTSAQIVMQTDGTALVTWSNVPPGQYLIGASSVRSVWQVKSATMAAKDVLDQSIEVRSGAELADVTVVLTDLQSPLTGVVQDKDQRPAANRLVAIFAVDQKFWITGSRRLTLVRTAADGRFTISTLPPGDYFVAALDGSQAPALDSPAWLTVTSRLATRVTLREGEPTSITLTQK